MIVRPMTCPVFIGRDVELAALHEARRGLAQSKGRVVLVAGEPGVGKSRLLAQFLGTVSRDPRPRYLARTECIERAERPFGPFRDLIASLGGTFGTLSEAPLDKQELFARAASFFAGLAEKRSTIVAIEDIHWADRSSLELLSYLATRIAGTRLLVIATYRTEDIERDEERLLALSPLWHHAAVERITLEPFDAGNTRELIRGALGGRADVPEPAREDIVRRSEGNPFFAEELLKAAAESRTGSTARLPISIRATIAARLSSLSKHERDIVSRAAVLGFRFEPETLAISLGTSLEDVLPVLRRGRDLNIFIEETEGRPLFRFRHALMREVAYESLLAFDARRTHATILRALEAAPDGGRVDALAYHAWAAGDGDKTLRYNERAGGEAAALHALPEARVFFERALAACVSQGDQARLSERLGRILEVQGQLGAAIERYDAAIMRYRALGDYDNACNVTRMRVCARNNAGEGEVVSSAEAFLDEHWGRISIGPRDALLAMLARLSLIRFDSDRAERLLARIEAPHALELRAQQNVTLSRLELAYDRGDAVAFRPIALELFELLSGDLPPITAYAALYTIAQNATTLGLLTLARDAFARVDRFEARVPVPAVALYGMAIVAWAAYFTGDLDVARRAIVRGSADTADSGVGRTALGLVAPLVSSALGEPSLVSPAAEAVLRDFDRNSPTPNEASVLASAARLALDRGDEASARNDLRLAVDALPRIYPCSGTIVVPAAEHLPAEDLDALRALIAQPSAEGDVAGLAHKALGAAILARRFPAGGDDAPSLARRAAEAYRTLGHPLFEARALEAAGEHVAARALYVRCGAMGDVRRLDGPVDDATSIAGAAAEAASIGERLSAREEAVARAVASGATNAQIADTLSISVRTVEKHVAAIFAKLGLRSRSQIAAAYAREA